MKYGIKTVHIVSLCILSACLSAAHAHALTVDEQDKSRSPYFFVQSDDPDTDRLPLKKTHADVSITGVIADVTLQQVYKNEGSRPLEALYIFPASTRAAVYGMTMKIGERTVTAVIKEREQARRDYEAAVRQGQSASLLEQQRPNVFRMNVGNILPGDTIVTELRYTELLVPQDGVYSFVYPTVVGPRYPNRAASGGPASDWVANPYLAEGKKPTCAFDIQTTLSTGMPVQDISCPSHTVKTEYRNPDRAIVTLDPSERDGGNRDFILRYRLAGNKIASGLLLYEGQKENFFLLTAQPPRSVEAGQIPPREYIFIVDVSGSMHGFPLDIAKKLMRDLIGGLKPSDTFNVLLFAGCSSLLSEHSLRATPHNIRTAIDFIDRRQGGGGTELLPALKRALALPRSEGCSRTVVIATDGYVSAEAEAFDLIRTNLGKAGMFSFGIGSSVNRHLIEGMARAGMGEPFVITNEKEAPGKADAFRRMISTPVLTGVTVDFGSLEVYDVEPRSVPDVFAGRPVIVFGKWRGKPRGTITVKGTAGDTNYRRRIDAANIRPSASHAALQHLWARHRIALLGDYNLLRRDDERIREITRLGLSYSLLTAYTSFVAIDSLVRVQDGKPVTVRQPLPLPQGVSGYAVGNGVGAMKAYRRRTAPQSAVSGRALHETPAADEVRAEEKDDASRAPRVSIRQLRCSEKSAEQALRSGIEQHLEVLAGCLKNVAAGRGAEIRLQLSINGSGRVTGVKTLSVKDIRGKGRFNRWKRCLVEKIENLRFSVPAGMQGVTAEITFSVS